MLILSLMLMLILFIVLFVLFVLYMYNLKLLFLVFISSVFDHDFLIAFICIVSCNKLCLGITTTDKNVLTFLKCSFYIYILILICILCLYCCYYFLYLLFQFLNSSSCALPLSVLFVFMLCSCVVAIISCLLF
jgi:hypothetical protein